MKQSFSYTDRCQINVYRLGPGGGDNRDAPVDLFFEA